MPARELKVNCPTCKDIVVWHEASVYRPFCSKRCQLIDFGEWAQERFIVAGEPVAPEPDDEYGGS